MGERAQARYGKLAQTMRAEMEKIPERGVEPDEVAKAIEHALTWPRPKLRYVVGTGREDALEGQGACGRPALRRADRAHADWK